MPWRLQSLRILRAVGSGRIARKHRREQCHILVRLDLQPHAGRSQRIRRTAASDIGGIDRGPAEGAVDEAARGRAGQEFIVGRELAGAN